MRIAYIVNQFPSISQTFVLNQITGLIDRGHSVDIYAESPSLNDSKIHQDVYNYDLIQSTYYFNQPSNKLLGIVKAIGVVAVESAKNISFLQFLLRYLRCRKEEAMLPRWQLPYIVRAFINQPDYDIIHCHFGPNGIKGALLKEALCTNSICVTTFHGYDLTKFIKTGSNPYCLLFKHGNLFLPISEHWKECLIKLGCNEEKIQVHHMGVDVAKFVVSQRYENKNIRITSVARLTEKKGIEYGIRAAQKLKQMHFSFEYQIIGEGLLRQDLQILIEELDLNDHVKLLGCRSQSDVVKILSESHILLAPSVTASDGDKEGIPVVLMEAMAMEIPVVSTWHSGIPELVEDKKTGFLVPERDVDAIAHSLMQLAKSADLRSELGRQGRHCIKEKFDIEKLNDQLALTFERLISTGNE